MRGDFGQHCRKAKTHVEDEWLNQIEEVMRLEAEAMRLEEEAMRTKEE